MVIEYPKLLTKEYPYLPEGREIKYVPASNEFMQEAKKVSSEAGCAKQPTGSVIVKEGVVIGRGCNAGKKIEICPRVKKGSKTGEDYQFCKEVCQQEGHSEVQAVKNAIAGNQNTQGADLYLYGHWWCCKECWDAMINAGIKDVYLLEDADKKFKL